MIRTRLMGLLVAIAVAAVAPSTTVAQEEGLSPEGTDWTLAGYLAEDELTIVPVPLGVDATLRLEGGLASGSGGCNTFTGSYRLEGSTLTFGDEITQTLALCEDAIQLVEDAYLSLLPDVAGWAIVDGVLQLSDELGGIVLTYEVPGITWTSSQIAGLVAALQAAETETEALRLELETLRGDVEGLNVDRLRQRIRTLESDNTKLKEQLADLEGRPSPTPQPVSGAFSNAEKILLEGIPKRIADRCQPLRSGLPKATRAAVRCTPNTSAVSSVDYFLMEGDDAANSFANTMSTFNVQEATSLEATCASGTKSQLIYVGGGWQSEGCYRTSGRAQVRFVDNATDCRKLRVGGKRLQSPAIYIALQGTNNDVARVHAWATKSLDETSGQLTSITQPIERPNEQVSPSCPT